MVVGGQAPKAIRSVECFDFKEQKWCECADMPTRRCRAGMAIIDNQVYAVGGFNGSLRVKTVEVYDTQLDSWSTGPPMSARRSTLGVAVIGTRIYAVIYFYFQHDLLARGDLCSKLLQLISGEDNPFVNILVYSVPRNVGMSSQGSDQ